MIPFITSRTSTWRLLPPRLAGGIKGSTCAHSSSVRSLGYRNLLRSSRPRFFAVHIGGAPLESGHHFESQAIQRIQNVFGRTLRKEGALVADHAPSMRPQHGPWRRCCYPPTLTYGPTFPFVQFKSPEAGERMRAVFRAQAVGPAREANMYRARRQTLRGGKTGLGWRPRFGQRIVEARAMSMTRKFWIGLLASFVAVTAASVPAAAQEQQQKPNILFIMGDDIGWMQPSIYHRGLM